MTPFEATLGYTPRTELPEGIKANNPKSEEFLKKLQKAQQEVKKSLEYTRQQQRKQENQNKIEKFKKEPKSDEKDHQRNSTTKI